MRDVVVVGAGPADSFAAAKCASSGLDVLLIDAERFPRDKACGGIISERVVRLVGGDVMPVIERVGTGNDFYYDWKYVGSSNKHEYFMKRRRFDQYLVRRAADAGAELKEGVRATGLTITREAAVVHTSKGDVETKIVVGADGTNSVIGRAIGLWHHSDSCKYASLKAEIDAAPRIQRDLGVDEPPRQKTYFFSDLVGFAWIVPNGASVNAGFGSTVSKAKGLKSRFHEFLGRFGLQPQLERGAQIPFAPLPRVYGERVLLTGDAGGFVNPWTGCGIEDGITASEKAAIVCQKAVGSNDFSPAMMSTFQELTKKQIARINWRGKWIKALDRIMPQDSSFPFWVELLVRKLAPLA